MKRFLSLALIINLLSMPVLALEFDTSLDDEVRKNYNPSKIEADMALPALPKILNETQSNQTIPVTQVTKTVPQSKPQQAINHQQPLPQSEVKLQAITQNQYKQTNSQGNCVTLRQGTKIKVRLLNSVSDQSKRGTRVTFVSKYPVSTTYFTIPTGTIFKGEILHSHKPQLSGNGGLIVIKIDSVILNNEIQPINASVTEANSKRIFLNNIKGKRKYISSMFKSMKPGCHYFKKMIGVSWDLAGEGSSIFVAPFALALGAVAAGTNIIASPAIALLFKGGPIYINANSDFELKLLQDVFIYK